MLSYVKTVQAVAVAAAAAAEAFLLAQVSYNIGFEFGRLEGVDRISDFERTNRDRLRLF